MLLNAVKAVSEAEKNPDNKIKNTSNTTFWYVSTFTHTPSLFSKLITLIY